MDMQSPGRNPTFRRVRVRLQVRTVGMRRATAPRTL
jgi:hypothetical protein